MASSLRLVHKPITDQRQLRLERDKLERQQAKLMETHYAGAVPIELLKNEQDRIVTAIKNIDQQALALTSHFDNIECNLTIALDLL